MVVVVKPGLMAPKLIAVKDVLDSPSPAEIHFDTAPAQPALSSRGESRISTSIASRQTILSPYLLASFRIRDCFTLSYQTHSYRESRLTLISLWGKEDQVIILPLVKLEQVGTLLRQGFVGERKAAF